MITADLYWLKFEISLTALVKWSKLSFLNKSYLGSSPTYTGWVPLGTENCLHSLSKLLCNNSKLSLRLTFMLVSVLWVILILMNLSSFLVILTRKSFLVNSAKYFNIKIESNNEKLWI